MKNPMLLMFTTLIVSCAPVGPHGVVIPVGDITSITIDVSAAETYIDLLSYIRSKHSDELDLEEGTLSDEEIKERIAENRKDETLTAKIEALISCPAYTELASKMRSFNKLAWGKNAYREAFYHIPWQKIGMRGGVDTRILEFILMLDDAFRTDVNSIINELKSSASAERVIEGADEWLPDDYVHPETYQVYVYFDGNRGSFATDDAYYLDLISHIENLNEPETLTEIEDVESHELHHFAYERWLNENEEDLNNSVFTGLRSHALDKWRKEMVLEGTAQFCNFDTFYHPFVKEMFFDFETANTYFEEWQDTFIKVSKGDMSVVDFEKKRLDDYGYGYGVERLNEYLNRFYTEEEITEQLGNDIKGYRVDLHYYIGYRVFRAIYDDGGREAYQYAITHPEELLSLYLEICKADPLLPQISEEMTEAWASL